MRVRIVPPLLMHGSIQFVGGQQVDLPKPLASELIARKEAVEVPFAEQAVMPRPTPITVPRPKPTPRPRPETRRQTNRGR